MVVLMGLPRAAYAGSTSSSAPLPDDSGRHEKIAVASSASSGSAGSTVGVAADGAKGSVAGVAGVAAGAALSGATAWSPDAATGAPERRAVAVGGDDGEVGQVVVGVVEVGGVAARWAKAQAAAAALEQLEHVLEV